MYYIVIHLNILDKVISSAPILGQAVLSFSFQTLRPNIRCAARLEFNTLTISSTYQRRHKCNKLQFSADFQLNFPTNLARTPPPPLLKTSHITGAFPNVEREFLHRIPDEA
jgi:hypothetical protein